MSFDSNPQAVYHGVGFGSLVRIGSPIFTVTGNFSAASSNAFHISTNTEPGQVILVGTSGGTNGDANNELAALNVDDIPDAAETAGQAPTNANSASWVGYGAANGRTVVRMSIARDGDGNIMLASSTPASLGGANMTLNIYKVA